MSPKRAPIWAQAPRYLLLASYPVLSHLAATQADRMVQSRCEWAAFMALFVGCFYTPLLERHRGAWTALVACGSLCAALLVLDPQGYALYLPPLAIPAMVASVFALSLRPGRTPLVTQMATVFHGGVLPAPLRGYTRAVTWLWTLFLLAVMATEIGLALFGTRRQWSLMSNFYSYLLLLALFVGEYAYRRIRYRKVPQPGLADYVKLLATRPHLAAASATKPGA